MPDPLYGSLGDAKRAVRSYVQEQLSLLILSDQAERVIDIETSFSSFLADKGVESNLASELSAAQHQAVRRKVAEHIGRWGDQGLSPPCGFHVDQDRLLITWRHDRFEELTGHPTPDASQFEIQRWVAGMLNRDFLLPCACYLHSMGCDPVLITDGSRDEGIDLIGLLRDGPMRSTVLYVQAKSQSRITGDDLLREFAKFSALPQTDKHRAYLEAVGFPRLTDGATFVYLCLVNGDFDFSAQTNARNLGALLRSRRQISDQLSRFYSRDRLLALQSEIVIPNGADLTRNLASLIGP